MSTAFFKTISLGLACAALGACMALPTSGSHTQNIRTNAGGNPTMSLPSALKRCDQDKDGASCLYVGHVYEHGWQGASKDNVAAMRYYQESARLGYFRAYQSIGYMYEQGLSVSKDYAQARQWYEKGVAAGDENAMLYLANIYQYGRGVPTDLNRALQLANQACASGERYLCMVRDDIQKRITQQNL
ncbi:tetratricopeptide repeat protein [Snodgrassella sp. CFCC 13594]|uniref:tetratricopeptide repeat protein n=1 Tax=Snodgrassella sp. CFCC 13594 TaxID=1775559 RepID=UPI00082CB462|nr:tetratricopeptide repeat protein [Snodgrassella sp. CFCC 13594]